MPDSSLKRTILTSASNPRIKNVIKLRKADYRKKTQTFIVEGCRELSRALSAGIEIQELYFCPGLFSDTRGESSLLKTASEAGGRLFEVSEPVYEKIAFGNRSEGMIAVAGRPSLSFKDIHLKDSSLFVVVEGVEKPGNLGAIIRTAQAAGADAILVADAHTDIYNPHTVRSSLGALFEACVVQAQSSDIISWLKEREVRIICACVQGDLAYTAVDFRGRFAIVVGSEEKGLTRLWKESADFKVTIPMAGNVDSLNVSCAAAILLFEAVRQRGDIARR